MYQKIIRSGNSLAVTIPSPFVKSLGIKKGDSVFVERDLSHGKLIYHFAGVQQLSIADRLPRRRKTAN